MKHVHVHMLHLSIYKNHLIEKTCFYGHKPPFETSEGQVEEWKKKHKKKYKLKKPHINSLFPLPI